MKLRSLLTKLAIGSAGAAVTFGLAACGNSKFQKQEFRSVAVAAQYTRPKIDILVAQDNSSSMITPMSTVRSQLAGFLSGLDSRWDYHFAVVPLQSVIPLSQKWIVAQDCAGVSNCLSSSQASAFNSVPAGNHNAGWINDWDTNTANSDNGLANIIANLSHPDMTNTGFLRSDAALALIVISNGDDVSNMSYPTDYTYLNGQNGMMVPNYSSSSALAYTNGFVNFLTGLKHGSSLMKFYSVVANNYHLSADCYGSTAWAGTRYQQVSAGLGSTNYDFCNSASLSGVLSSISAQLQNLIQAFQFNYAVLDGNPVQSSIKVTKNGVSVPRDTSHTNGWDYVGWRDNQPLAFAPQSSTVRSGYMIEFFGNAVYSGTDIIDINFQKQ